jgi:hypothetical protein
MKLTVPLHVLASNLRGALLSKKSAAKVVQYLFDQDMKSESKALLWWAVPLLLLLLPLVLVVLVFWSLYSLALYLLVWTCWLTRGREILFVYSDSPHWKEYIETEILPRIQDRAIILNWSERRKWIQKMTLGPMLFRHFGGYKEFNPVGIYFRPFHLHQSYRFWEPILIWRKKGDKKELEILLDRFYGDLGL